MSYQVYTSQTSGFTDIWMLSYASLEDARQFAQRGAERTATTNTHRPNQNFWHVCKDGKILETYSAIGELDWLK
jgi:hypothetical protein